MIDGNRYLELVKLFFSFLNTEFGYKPVKETKNGNVFYDIEYCNTKNAISISYENMEDYLQVIVFRLKNGQYPDYDDKKNTLHLSILNKIILSKIGKQEMKENNALFEKFETKDGLERKLLKSAKELRLSLPYLDCI